MDSTPRNNSRRRQSLLITWYFDVQMPLRYGEGMANAFKRLEEKIGKFNKCLQDLCLSDPRDNKTRIKDTKGRLLEGLYYWVLKTSDFQR